MFDLEMISPRMLDYYVDHPGVLLIDLREEEEYQHSHLKGAVNIPFDEEKYALAPPKDQEIVLYCERGNLSMAAARDLAKRGYRARSVVGGLRAYDGRYLVHGNKSQ